MEYFGILAQTWKLIWKHKAILAFGLLSMLIPGLMVILMGGFMLLSGFDHLSWFEQVMNNEAWFALILVGFFGVFMLISFVATGIGWTAVFKGTFDAEKGDEDISFSELWKSSWPFIGRVLGILFLIGFGLSLFFMVPAILGILTAGVAFLCMIPMMVIFIPLAFLSQMYMALCIASSVADDIDVFTAIKRAWNVTLKNFWPLVLISLLLYLIQMAAGMVVSIPAWFAQFLFMFPIMNENIHPETMFKFFGIFMLVIMPLAFLIQGAAQTYVNSAWMLVYLDRINAEKTHSPETPLIVESDA